MIKSVHFVPQVDFFWINREQRSFEWFVSLLSQLEIEQAESGARFLEMHMYITSALQRSDMKAVGLQLALDLLHEKVSHFTPQHLSVDIQTSLLPHIYVIFYSYYTICVFLLLFHLKL